jgi:Nif-specific regulatory protein
LKPKPLENCFSQKEFDLFYEISTSIHETLDLNEMLKRILLKIRSVFQIEGASLAIHDPDGKEFFFIRTVEDSHQPDAARMRRMRFADHLGVAGWVLRRNQPVIIQDVSKDDRFFKGIDLQENFVTRNMICLPLRTPKGTIGVLYALNKLEGAFTEKEAKLLEVLSGTIAVALENARLYGELKQHADSLEEENVRLKSQVQSRFGIQRIVGSSTGMRRVFDLLEKVMDTKASVLLQGETGTGKELIAKAIHFNGPLKDKPFVAENCGALSETLLESELFGHVKGAFTGAVADKKGLFETAGGGTVFLDEISEMSPAMQVKLLRVLQEGQVRPVGSSSTIDVDFRLISSTNRDLEEEVRKANFREDLLYRINVFPIVLPPLRDRKEDIPSLAAHFLEKFARKLKRPVLSLSARVLNLLTQYDWPGNIRELENEIERAVILAGDSVEIREDSLSEKIMAPLHKPYSAQDLEGSLQEVVENVEQQMIVRALQQTGGNRSQAARLLGLTRQGLLNKISRYSIRL